MTRRATSRTPAGPDRPRRRCGHGTSVSWTSTTRAPTKPQTRPVSSPPPDTERTAARGRPASSRRRRPGVETGGEGGGGGRGSRRRPMGMSARAGGDGGAGPPVLVLTGMGGLTGIGKTALTQHAAHASLTAPSPWTSATAAGTGPRTRATPSTSSSWDSGATRSAGVRGFAGRIQQYWDRRDPRELRPGGGRGRTRATARLRQVAVQPAAEPDEEPAPFVLQRPVVALAHHSPPRHELRPIGPGTADRTAQLWPGVCDFTGCWGRAFGGKCRALSRLTRPDWRAEQRCSAAARR